MEFSGLNKGINFLKTLNKQLREDSAKIFAHLVIIGCGFPAIAYFFGGEQRAFTIFGSMVGNDSIYKYCVAGIYVVSLLLKWVFVFNKWNLGGFFYKTLDELSNVFISVILIISGFLLFSAIVLNDHYPLLWAVLSIVAFCLYAWLAYFSNFTVDEFERVAKERADKKARTRQAN
ncbi:Uncharacterised protein [Yersinia enterocolitica]|uniref:hypothetical protein n=1 Tax=Yersinia enterocolitica TaxID=630 RepID=UPI0005DD01A6|nr:hypothetical protein [Yersinia enterocolitica]CNG91962.1 Uncharacterised protein [Yersinia enterocolitica]